MAGDFKACLKCVPPKRYPGCHDHCQDYLAEKAEHEKEKVARDFQRKIKGGLIEQRSKAVYKAMSSSKVVNKGICDK